MKKYSIGEALCKFEIDSIAYIFKGNAKGALIWVDLNNDNRLVMAYDDGHISHGLHISIQDIPKEEGKCIVFFDEVRKSLTNDMSEEEYEILTKLSDEMQEAIDKMVDIFHEGVAQLSTEEQDEIYARLSKQQAEREVRLSKQEG